MNVLLLTIDSLRADRVGGHGLTPALDALGADGANFTQAVTHGHGTPVAFPALLSGTYPMLYGGCSRFAEERPALARELRQAGYGTAAFTSNPHLFDKYGYDTGFEEFNEFRRPADGDGTGDGGEPWFERVRHVLQTYVKDDNPLYRLLRRAYYFILTASDERPYAPADEVNDRVLDWLDGRDGDRPFFLWAHYMDVHYPFYQDEEWLSAAGADPIPKRRQRRLNRLMHDDPDALDDEDIADLRALYDAELRFTDAQLDHLLEALEERGLREETLVVVTSDHGEALGEHGAFGHYKALYEELFRVPLVVAGPDIDPATVDSQVGLVDVEPTLLDYLDLPLPDALCGESLRPLIEGDREQRTERRLVVGHGDPLGVRTDRWKYVWWDRDGATPTDSELFDLQADPGETVDVSADHPDVVEAFDEFLADHVAEADRTDVDDSGDGDLDEEIEDQLEALGYR